MNRSKIYILFAALLATIPSFSQSLAHLYKVGENGYSCFRIPAIVSTTKGTLLAFAEARKDNCGDAGNIDLVVKRSSDNGKTWSELSIVWDDSTNTCGNPSPIVDAKTGKIILLATWNLGTDHEKDIIKQTSKDSRRVFVLSSKDDGRTWSKPDEITSSVKKDNWTWYATGPGNGIQIKKGKYKGRLVVACDHIESGSNRYYSHAIYSDDHGKKWKLGGTTQQDSVNESTIAELSDGSLMLNMRNYSKTRIRQVAITRDGGESFEHNYGDSSLTEPVCQGNLISAEGADKKRMLIFSNPASTSSRTDMTVRISYDDGKTWPLKTQLYAGPAAYSNLVMLANGNIGCFYEAGYGKPYEGIVFEEITLSTFVAVATP